MTSNLHWKPGDTVVMRGVWKGLIVYACPVTVVKDEPGLLAFYLPCGTLGRQMPGRMPAREMIALKEARLVEHTWVETDVLMLAVPGEACSIWLMWEAGQRKLRCWYVNLEEPLQRTSIGFDSMDWQLDIVISSDRTKWRWKDEDEFADWLEAGLISQALAGSLCAAAEEVLRKLEENRSPFCDGWENWTPPSGWTIPVLLQGWDEQL
jgi:hypothetical protein